MDAEWQPIKEPGTLTDKITERIEKLIAAQHLRSGDRLPSEREMAKLLGVSRPALREAVKTLVAHDRLVVRHGQGVFVAMTGDEALRISLANLEVSLQELFAMREVLEGPAAAWAAERALPEEILALEEALNEERAAREAPVDLERLGKLDAAFHLRIVELAKNRFLGQTLGVLHEMLASGMQTTLSIPGRPQKAWQDHLAIFEAIRRRDGDAARVAVLNHIRGARDAAMNRVRDEAARLGSGGSSEGG